METPLYTLFDKSFDNQLYLLESRINEVHASFLDHLTKIFNRVNRPNLLDYFIRLIKSEFLFSHHIGNFFSSLINLLNFFVLYLLILFEELFPENLLLSLFFDFSLFELEKLFNFF